MYNLKLGTSVSLFSQTDYRKEYFQDIKDIKKLGFYSVDLSLDNVGGYKHSMEKCSLSLNDALKAIVDSGLILNGVHLPFGPFNNITSYDDGDFTAVDIDPYNSRLKTARRENFCYCPYRIRTVIRIYGLDT